MSKGWKLEKHQGLLWLPAVSVETQPAWQLFFSTAGGLCVNVCVTVSVCVLSQLPLQVHSSFLVFHFRGFMLKNEMGTKGKLRVLDSAKDGSDWNSKTN